MGHFNFPNQNSLNNGNRCITWAVLMFFFMVGTVASVSDLRERHSFIALEKLYEVIRTVRKSRCNIEDKNIWKREVVFEVLTAEVKFLSFLKIC